MSMLTAGLGEFVADLALQAVPIEGHAVAKTGITDCFGVMIAGSTDPAVALVDRELSSADGAALAPLYPSGALRNVADAALVNGVASHVLDYDDVTLDGHPSAVLMPAILAQGHASGSSGAEMLAAYIAGYEVWAELLIREPVPLHQKGWHPTAVRGAIAAAAACAKLRRMDAKGVSTAMAIAASMSAGLVANFGTLTKSFQVGRAAQSGVIAARLAKAGLTAAEDALEHPSGFLAALSPKSQANLKLPFDASRKEWHIVRQGLNLKRYPNCYGTHRAIDAAVDLVIRHDLHANDVKKICVFTGRTQMTMLRHAKPQSAFEAKFSMQFAMAASVIARNVGLSQLVDEFVRDPAVQGLFSRIAIETTDEVMDGSAFAPSESVEITTAKGDVLKSDIVVHAKGSKLRPLTRDELWTKFSDCLGCSFSTIDKERAFDMLMNLDRQSQLNALIRPTAR